IAGASVLLYLVETRRLSEWRRLRPFLGIVVTAAATAPWFFAMESRQPGFLKFFFWHEHVQRYMDPSFEHQEPWYFYFAALPLLFFPWSVHVRSWKGLFEKKDAPADDLLKFLFISTLVTMLFYSLSRSKLL